MKISKQLGTRIIKLSNMDDIVCELYEGVDDNNNPIVLGKDCFQINVMTGSSPETSLMNVTPWVPFAKDEFIPIYYDSILTIVTPLTSFEEYYINVRNRWKRDTLEDFDFKSSSDRLDDVEGPTDEELEVMEELEALMSDKKTLH